MKFLRFKIILVFVSISFCLSSAKAENIYRDSLAAISILDAEIAYLEMKKATFLIGVVPHDQIEKGNASKIRGNVLRNKLKIDRSSSQGPGNYAMHYLQPGNEKGAGVHLALNRTYDLAIEKLDFLKTHIYDRLCLLQLNQNDGPIGLSSKGVELDLSFFGKEDSEQLSPMNYSLKKKDDSVVHLSALPTYAVIRTIRNHNRITAEELKGNVLKIITAFRVAQGLEPRSESNLSNLSQVAKQSRVNSKDLHVRTGLDMVIDILEQTLHVFDKVTQIFSFEPLLNSPKQEASDQSVALSQNLVTTHQKQDDLKAAQNRKKRKNRKSRKNQNPPDRTNQDQHLVSTADEAAETTEIPTPLPDPSSLNAVDDVKQDTFLEDPEREATEEEQEQELRELAPLVEVEQETHQPSIDYSQLLNHQEDSDQSEDFLITVNYESQYPKKRLYRKKQAEKMELTLLKGREKSKTLSSGSVQPQLNFILKAADYHNYLFIMGDEKKGQLKDSELLKLLCNLMKQTGKLTDFIRKDKKGSKVSIKLNGHYFYFDLTHGRDPHRVYWDKLIHVRNNLVAAGVLLENVRAK